MNFILHLSHQNQILAAFISFNVSIYDLVNLFSPFFSGIFYFLMHLCRHLFKPQNQWELYN